MIRGRLIVDRRTKNLLRRIRSNEIAVIAHDDLDEVAVQGLIKAKVKAVVNACKSVSGRYPNAAPLELLEAGIPLLDHVGEDVLHLLEGQWAELKGTKLWVDGKQVAEGQMLDVSSVQQMINLGRENYNRELELFAQNTLEYAQKELEVILQGMAVPSLAVDMGGKHVLIVVRGRNYREDLEAIRTYILEERPIIIAVDGGADAVLGCGFKPDIIIGDMDSISDRALKCGATRLVHAYPGSEKANDGLPWHAPGLERLEKLGLNGLVLPAPGTSEDVAMLLAYEKGASLIVAVGTHSNMLDFLDKGRGGMASTMLVRMKVGEVLVDARGVSQLYRRGVKFRHLAEITLAALVPFGVVLFVSTPVVQLVRLLMLRMRVSFGI